MARLAIAYREEKLRGIEAPVMQSWATPKHLREEVRKEEQEEEVSITKEEEVGEGNAEKVVATDIGVKEEVIEGTAGEREKALLRRKFGE